VRVLSELDLLIGGGLAVVVAILDVMGRASSTQVSAAILALLALLISLLWKSREGVRSVRDVVNAQSHALQGLAARLDGETAASQIFRFDYPDLSDMIEQSSEVLVVAAGSLRTTVGSYFRQFQSAASNGASIRLVCPDPTKRTLMWRFE
jgi:hypothetical protein